jgi:hypothetical protein
MTTVASHPDTTASFARHAMITCAVVSPLAIALPLLLAPSSPTAEGEPYVQSFVDHLDSYSLWSWFGALSVATLIPAIFAVSKVARSGRPVLGLWGMILAFVLAVPFEVNTDDVIYAAAKSGLDVRTTARLLDGLDGSTPTSVLGFSFFVALLGLVLLGVAALRSQAPKWAAVALIVAPVLIPVPWLAGLPAVVAGCTWLLLTAALGGVALALPSR